MCFTARPLRSVTQSIYCRECTICTLVAYTRSWGRRLGSWYAWQHDARVRCTVGVAGTAVQFYDLRRAVPKETYNPPSRISNCSLHMEQLQHCRVCSLHAAAGICALRPCPYKKRAMSSGDRHAYCMYEPTCACPMRHGHAACHALPVPLAVRLGVPRETPPRDPDPRDRGSDGTCTI